MLRILIICLLSFAFGCRSSHYSPEEGDLLFQVTPGNAFTDAITEVTEGREGIPFSHVAMVVRHEDRIMVLEAVPESGVRLLSLDSFLTHSAFRNGHPLVVAARLRDRDRVDEACTRAMSFLGTPYDAAFLPGSDALYCSELIHESYLDEKGAALFIARPMNFQDSCGRIIPYWSEHYASLGIPVPQGIPGTNPGDLSKDPALKIVFSFFSNGPSQHQNTE